MKDGQPWLRQVKTWTLGKILARSRHSLKMHALRALRSASLLTKYHEHVGEILMVKGQRSSDDSKIRTSSRQGGTGVIFLLLTGTVMPRLTWRFDLRRSPSLSPWPLRMSILSRVPMTASKPKGVGSVKFVRRPIVVGRCAYPDRR